MLHKYNIKPSQETISERLGEPGRFDDFSARVPGMLLDFSHTSLDHQAMSQLLKLAEDSGVGSARARLFSGEAINFTESRPALHMAMRDDRLIIRTWADSFRRTSMVMGQEIVREDDPTVVVARAKVFAVWIGPDRKPMRVPPDLKQVLTGEAPLPSATS